MIYIPVYFDLEEIVCPHVNKKYGVIAWSFFDPRLLITLDRIRELLDKPIYVNNWNEGGQVSQRGFRCIQCDLVKSAITKDELYVSAHMEGQAVDFDVEGMRAAKVRLWLVENEKILPYSIRLENNVEWTHLDVRQVDGRKIVFFNS